MSELVVGSIAGLAANSYVVDVAAGSTLDLSAGAVFPAGNVIQVVSTTKDDTFTLSSTSFVDITGLSATITPKFASSKILVIVSNQARHLGSCVVMTKLVRGSTDISIGATSGTRTRTSTGEYTTNTLSSVHNITYLDSPSTTSATTYKVQALVNTSTVQFNSTGNGADDPSTGALASSITLIEVAG